MLSFGPWYVITAKDVDMKSYRVLASVGVLMFAWLGISGKFGVGQTPKQGLGRARPGESTKVRTASNEIGVVSGPTPVQLAPMGSPGDVHAKKLWESMKFKEVRIYSFDAGVEIDSRVAPGQETQVVDKGTVVVANYQAKGDDLVLQKTLCQAISSANIRPVTRELHFAWLQTHPLFLQKQVRFVGWHGGIVETRQIGPNAWRAKVNMYPWLYNPNHEINHPDYVTEIYEYSNGVVHLVDSDANTLRPERQILSLY